MMFRRSLASVLLFLFCHTDVLADELVVDGGTAASTREAVEQVSTPSTMEEQVAFMAALLRLQFSEFESAEDVPPELRNLNYEHLSSRCSSPTPSQCSSPTAPSSP